LSRKTKRKPERSRKAEKPCAGWTSGDPSIASRPLTVGEILVNPLFGAEVLTGKKGLRTPVRDHRPLAVGVEAGGRQTRGEGRIHILGRKVLSHLAGLPLQARRRQCGKICRVDASAMVVPAGEKVPDGLIEAAKARELPLLASALPRTRWRQALRDVFEERNCPQTSAHGVLMEVSGVGLLILGPSGIGKSESALDLVTRGHRLIADDLIMITRTPGGGLVGRGADHAGFHMEIRGLGIINIQDLYGVAAVLESREIELVVDLRDWESLRHIDRLGLEEERYELLGLSLPYLRIPVTHGRNMAVILEVAARNQLLKKQGRNTAREFEQALKERLAREGGGKDGGRER
jgi:HPr kinase/phosphorylase